MAWNIEKESVTGSKPVKTGFDEELALCETEDAVETLKQRCREDLRADEDKLINRTRSVSVEDVQFIIRTVLSSDEVIPKKVFEFATKNPSPSGSFDEFPEISFEEMSLVDIKAVIGYCYYASQHRNNFDKCNRKLEFMNSNYRKGVMLKGDDTLEDYLGDL